MDEGRREAKKDKVRKKEAREREARAIHPFAPEMQSYYNLESKRVDRGLEYWVRHGSRYWDDKAKRARTPEQRYKAKMMRRVGATFVLSARYYLNALSMMTVFAEHVDESNQVLFSVKNELEDAGILKRQDDDASARRHAEQLARIRGILKAQLRTTEELRTYIV